MQQGRLWRNLVSITGGVTATAIALHLSGATQFLEFATFNQWFRLRTPESRKVPIVLVTIQESDIQWVDRWPLSDAQLAQLLKQIRQARPIAIGLDLYRDVPFEPGHKELLQVFRTTPNLIGIKKAIGNTTGPAVPAPPILGDRNQVGINDLLVDEDGIVRRNLLSVGQEEHSTPALGTKLALLYLQRYGITAKASSDLNQTTLGMATFRRLTPNAGGYVQVDTGGFQTLANFLTIPGGLPTVSLREVIENRVPAAFFQNKLVFIGAKAESTWSDRFYTPFTTDIQTAWAGVEIHANVAAQLISSALEGRPWLQEVPEWSEWLWILLWAGCGTVLGWWLRSMKAAFVLIPLSLASIFGFAYGAFVWGWWIISVPPALAFVAASLISRGYWVWDTLKQANYRLEEKVRERTQELVEKNLALEHAHRSIETANAALERLARMDELTRVANRRFFNEYLQQQWHRMHQAHLPLALILIDVDFFKLYNDTYGHPAGDECLAKVAAVLDTTVHRSTDLVARYGGEEFAIVLPNTSLTGVSQIAHMIQTNMQQLAIPHQRSQVSKFITLSMGAVWCVPSFQASPTGLINWADKALYEAKMTGRDRIVVTELSI